MGAVASSFHLLPAQAQCVSTALRFWPRVASKDQCAGGGWVCTWRVQKKPWEKTWQPKKGGLDKDTKPETDSWGMCMLWG